MRLARATRATRGESGAGWVARRMVEEVDVVSRVRIEIESEQEG